MSDTLLTKALAHAGNGTPTDKSILEQSGAAQDSIGLPDYEFANTYNALKSFADDSTFQDQLDNKSKTVDLIQKLLPSVPRDQIASRLPEFYQSITGHQHADGVNPLERIAQVVDNVWKTGDAEFSQWMQEKTDSMVRGVQGLVGTTGASPLGQKLSAQLGVENTANQAKTADKISKLDALVEKTSVDHGGQWWLPIVDNTAMFGASMAQMMPEAAAGGALAGPIGAAIGAWDASARLQAASSFKTMRARGVQFDIADAHATTIGQAAAVLDVLEIGTMARVALKPLIHEASNTVAKSLSKKFLEYGGEYALAVGAGTGEEVAQEGIAIAGENAAYKQENAWRLRDPVGRVVSASQSTGDALAQHLTESIARYNDTTLIQIDKPEEVAKRLADTAVSAAIGMAVLGGLGMGAGLSANAIQSAWDKKESKKEFSEIVSEVGNTVKASEAIKAAPISQSADGVPVFFAGNPDSLEATALGVELHTSMESAQVRGKATTTQPVKAPDFLRELEVIHPAVVEMARDVIANGPEAAKKYLVEGSSVMQWEKSSDGQYFASDIVEMADSIRTGEILAHRNNLLAHYGLESALPTTGLIEGRLNPDDIVPVGSEKEINAAFKSGAKAVQVADKIYIRDPKVLAVTAKSEAQASVTAKNQVGDLSFTANGNTIIARNSVGEEVGRLTHEPTAQGSRVTDVQVPEQFRRQGVATALVNYHRSNNVGKQVSISADSDAGTKLRDKIRKGVSERFYRGLMEAQEAGNQTAFQFYSQKLDKVYKDGEIGNLSPDEVRSVLMTGTLLSPEEVDAVAAVLERMADAAGVYRDDFLATALQTVQGVADADGKLRSNANGAYLVNKAMIQLKSAGTDPTTLIHEAFHALRPFLSREDQDTMLAWAGEMEWTVKAEELAARGFEKHILEGPHIGGPIDAILDKLKTWFRIIYDEVFGVSTLVASANGEWFPVELDDSVRKVYNGILAGKQSSGAPAFGQSENPMGLFSEDNPSILLSEDFDKHVDKALSDKSYNGRAEIRPITKSEGDRFRELISKDAQWGNFVLDGNEIRHMMNHHGDEIHHGQANLTPDDIKSLPDILDNITSIAAGNPVRDALSAKITSELDGREYNYIVTFEKGRLSVHAKGKTLWKFDGRVRAIESLDHTSVADPSKKRVVRKVVVVKKPLYSEDLDAEVLSQQLDAARLDLASLEDPKSLEKRIDAQARQSAAPRDQIAREFAKRTVQLREAIAADEQALATLRAAAASKPTPESIQKTAIQTAVDAGKIVPTSQLQMFAKEPWAAAELERRETLKDLMAESLKYDDMDSWLAASKDELAMSNPDFDVFNDEAPDLTPEQQATYKAAYLAAHMKDASEFDKDFLAGLDDAKVTEILAKLGTDEASMQQHRMPWFVKSAALKVANGKEVDPKELKRITTAIKRNPKPYRHQVWAYSEMGQRDEFLVEALAVEQAMEQAAREYEAPTVDVKPLELDPDLDFKLAAELRMSNESKNYWQNRSVKADEKAKALSKEASDLEKRIEEVKAQRDAAKAKATQERRDLKTQAKDEKLDALERQHDAFVIHLKTITDEMKQAQKEARAIRAKFQQMRDMAAYIARPVPKTIHVDEAQQIERMRAKIDPHFRRDEKVKIRAAENLWYSMHPEEYADLTDKQKRALNAKSLNLWSFEELEQEYQLRKHLEANGRFKLNYKLEQRAQRIGRIKREILGALYKDWEDFDKKVKQAESEVADAVAAGEDLKAEELRLKIKTWVQQRDQIMLNAGQADDKRGKGGDIQALIFTLANMADILDGGKDYKGPNVEALYRTPNQAENEFLTQKLRRVDAMFKWLKDEKIPTRDLFKRITVDGTGTTWTVDALIDMYIGMKNEKKAAAIRFGNNIDPRVLEFAQTAPELAWARKLGDKILDEYEENQERLFGAIAENENFVPGYEKFYSPMARAEIDLEAMDDQIKYEQGMATAVRAASVEKGFSISRLDIPDEYQKKIKLGAWTQWLEQVVRQEQYIAYAPVVKDLKSIYHASEIKNAIEQTRGSGYWHEIDTYINVLANRYWGKSFTSVDKFFNWFQSNAAIAFMSYNMSTALKQIPALFTFLGHVHPDLLIKSLLMLPHTITMANSKAPQQKGRIERFGFIAIDQGKKKNAVSRWAWEISHVGMMPMQLVDKAITAAGWGAAYETALRNGHTEQSAIDYADFVVDQTQQAGHPKAVAGAYRNQNALLRTLLMFTGPSNKIFNQVTYGNWQAISKGKFLKSAGITIGIAASMAVFWSIGKGQPPETEEDWLQALGVGMVELLPIIGPSLAAMMRGYNQGQAPAQQVVQTATETIQYLTKAQATTDAEKQAKYLGKAAQSALEALGLTTGIPVTEPVRIFRAADTGNAFELLGWRTKD